MKFPIPKCHASYLDEEIVYSPNKYRETEGIQGRYDTKRTRPVCTGKWLWQNYV